ncbi:hypothetical protein BZG36_05456 [Bifiguratus adelaidae]|uniref:O-methyltransferase C-terminal domain-containing protein n=1 Tax=Bifiguratus adelaidae TaxID=1938954 RepID=A0A261XU32_9FUNG|nr:hypothetical protein BZG36_05456 [Bifiguratus adelaidae]
MSANVATISKYLELNHGSILSFSPGNWHELPQDKDNEQVANARLALVKQTTLLRDLVAGPAEAIFRSAAHSLHDMTAITVILRYNLANAVPLDKEISFEQVAKISGLSYNRVRTVLRQAMVVHVFEEPHPGFVKHTAASALLVQDPGLRDVGRLFTEITVPCAGKLLETYVKFPNSEKPTEGPFNLAFETKGRPMECIASRPDLAMILQGGMSYRGRDGAWDNSHIANAYPWASLRSATVADIGGGNGHFSVSLAQRFPELRFIVQDLASTEQTNVVPPDLKDRITFYAHDFFTPQTVKADVYVLRFILHDWLDKEASEILRNLVPAMVKGSRVLLVDSVIVPTRTRPYHIERLSRMMDIHMMVTLNARERTEEDWKSVLQMADSRFYLNRIISPHSSFLSAIEVVWDP